MKKITGRVMKFLLFYLLASSCSIGNFGDIGGKRLFLFAGTDSSIISYEIDAKNDSLREKNSIWLPGMVNKIAADDKNRILLAASGDSLYGYTIHENGELEIIPGYPVAPSPGLVIQDFFFLYDYSYLFVTYGNVSSEVYGYIYNGESGNPSPMPGWSPYNLPDLPDEVESTNSNRFMYYSVSMNSWYSAALNSDGSPGAVTSLPSVAAPYRSSATAYGKYLCIIRDAVPPNPPYLQTSIHLFGSDSPSAGTPVSFSEAPSGGIALSVFSRIDRKLYFMHDAESMIYCIPVDEDGYAGNSVKSFNLSGITNFRALDTDPNGEYVAFSENTGPSYLYLMKLSREGLPENSFSHARTVGGNVLCLEFVRTEN